MISFNNIGNLGRLANQMFQYASLKGIASNRGFDFCIPPEEVFGRNDLLVRGDELNLYKVFPQVKNNNIDIIVNQVLQERTHQFDEDLFNNCPDNIDLFGYYQTHKYFSHIEEEIRKDFTFIPEVLDTCMEFFHTNFDNQKVISLHIRRGDYLHNPNHPTQSLEYYKSALDLLPNNLPVIVFSDDSNWCSQQELFDPDRFFISQDSSADADLCMMSLCDYHIIANSSFSWWGSWLAKSERTIAPKNWFGGDCIDKSVVDMEFGDWTWL